MKPAHRRGNHSHRHAARIVAAANANPNTRCWRDGLTLTQHPPHKNGKRPTWQAGHLRDGDPTSPLLAEASTCNTIEGGKLTARRQGITRATRDWTKT